MTDSNITEAAPWRSPIKTAGVYMDIPMDRYHGEEICPGPSVSSSGLRTIEAECPKKYWYNSPLNPDRPEREDKPHFATGRLLHEVIAEGEKAWRNWHILPEGFSDAHTKKWADEIAFRDEAVAQGKSVIGFAASQTVDHMAKAVLEHPRASLLFKRGKFEPTLAWQDKETGIWCRVRPDFLPDVRQWIPDLKSTISAAPESFMKSVDNYGYHMAAALYLEGIRVLFGERPAGFMYVAQEKTAPYITEIYQADEEAIGYGDVLNRRALRKLADCIDKGKWPTYGNDVNLVGLPPYTVKKLEDQMKAGLLDYPSHA